MPQPARRWWRTLLLALVAAAGQLSWLRLLDPDPWRVGLGGLEHLLGGAGRVAFPVLFVQGMILAVLAGRYRAHWRAAISAVGRGPIGIAILSIHLLAATAATRTPGLFPVHLALSAVCLGLGFLTLVAAAAEAGPGGVERAAQWLVEDSRVRWLAAGLTVAFAALLSGTVFDRIPHIPDEVAYLIQAKYLAHGLIALPSLSAPGALDVIHTLDQGGRWFGIFPPGWPALLAIGVRAGAPWLMNPLLAGCTVLVSHRLLERLYGLRTANLVAALLALSPWFVYSGASLMSHTASILAGVLALHAAVRLSDDQSSVAAGVVGGLALGWLVLIRPFDGILVGLLIAGWLCWRLKARVWSRRPLTVAILAVAVGSLQLPYNHALTGDSFRTPITEYFDTKYYPGANRLGFGTSVGNVGWGNDVLPGHSPLQALINANWNAHLTQLELFGWACGSLLFALVFLGRGTWYRSSADSLLVGLLAVTVIGYGLYWYSGADFGPRYWSQALVPLTALSVRGMLLLNATSASVPWMRLAALSSCIGFPLMVGWRGAEKYHNYRGVTSGIATVARTNHFARDLVLIRGDKFSDYAGGIVLNPGRWTDDQTLFLRYVGGEDLAKLRAGFPTRRVWIVDGASITGSGPRVVAGPLPPLSAP